MTVVQRDGTERVTAANIVSEMTGLSHWHTISDLSGQVRVEDAVRLCNGYRTHFVMWRIPFLSHRTWRGTIENHCMDWYGNSAQRHT